jgi:Uma2 family endonuclease
MNQIISQRLPASTNGQLCWRQTFVVDSDEVHLPSWVVDFASFRRWTETDEFPEKSARVCYLAGEIWIDMSREQIFTHNQVKAEISQVLGPFVKKKRLGRFFPDGALLTNVEVELSCKPDGVFVSEECFDRKRVRLVEGAREGYVELEGTPVMVLEVVSDSSVQKDTVTLRELYHRAGIREYWLIDVRRQLSFELLRHTRKGYTSTRAKDGWLKSQVFNRSFKLSLETDNRGNPEYTLRMQ